MTEMLEREWQPIFNAPRDGTKVLLLCSKFAGEITGIVLTENYAQAVETGIFTTGRSDYPGDNWWDLGGDAFACWGWPELWQPLPAPPLPASAHPTDATSRSGQHDAPKPMER